MGQRYLIDTNVIIDFCSGRLTDKGRNFVENIEPEISIITNIELFATQNISQNEIALLEKFVGISVIHPITVDLVKHTVAIRKHFRTKLPDALIAATAIASDLVLLSRNVADFGKIMGLRVVDLYSM